MSEWVAIHYRRLPDQLRTFEQRVLARTPEYIVTFLEAATIRQPSLLGGRAILEPSSPIVWFTYPGRWYDIGRFHLADGTFTGVYANILTPVVMEDGNWTTTDLMLDLWAGADGTIKILDEDEYEQAVAAGWLDLETAAIARETADALKEAALQGEWPPGEVVEWTLERARGALGV